MLENMSIVFPRCQENKCKGFLIPVKVLIIDGGFSIVWKCNTCGTNK